MTAWGLGNRLGENVMACRMLTLVNLFDDTKLHG